MCIRGWIIILAPPSILSFRRYSSRHQTESNDRLHANTRQDGDEQAYVAESALRERTTRGPVI